jgi:hypothetical protein
MTFSYIPEDTLLQVARGKAEGFTSVNKFGANIEIDNGVTADIWDGGHTLASGGVSLLWVAPTQARTHDIVSSSTSDDGDPAGVGARTLRIYGLTDWDTAEVTEDITLNGTTNVATSNAYVIIHRMRVLTKGATNVNVGVIKATAQTDNTITAQIRVSQGQTQMAIYGIPSTQKAYMGMWYASIARAAGAAGIHLEFNPEPGDEIANFLIKHTMGLETTGTSALVVPYYTPKVFAGPGIIRIQAQSAVNDLDVSAGFDIVLVDN